MPELLAPVDEYGMPYLLHPYDSPKGQTARWDDDHSFFFDSLPELADNAGRALRHSRVQHVPRWLHDRKHNIHYRNGVERLPATESDKFGLTVLACAGYASRIAIDVRGDTPKEVTMSKDTYDFVRGKKQLHVETRRNPVARYRTQEYCKKKIGRFFADYIRRQEIEDLDESIIDQFLHAANEQKRRRLGNVILGHALEVAVEPVEPKYHEALNAGLLRPIKTHPIGVVLQLFPQETWPAYHDSLEERFAA